MILKNRQSIDSNDQFDVNNETNDEIDNFNNETDQQFPPRMHKDDKEEETNLLVVTKI